MGKIKENIILNGILPLADAKFGTSLSKSIKLVKHLSKLEPEELKRWQLIRLQERIEHAYNMIPYYKRELDKRCVRPADIKSLIDLEKFPVITKEIIRAHYTELLPADLSKYSYHKGATGGSTGRPFRYLCDNKSWSMSNAFCILQRQSTGYHYGDKFIGLGGSSIGSSSSHSFIHKLYYKMQGKYAMASKGWDDNEFQRFVNFIVKNDIHFIYGYASVIYLFSKYVIDNQLQAIFNIRGIFPTSDMLTSHYSKTIVQAFPDAMILDSYGAFDSCIGGYRHLWNDSGYHCGYSTYIETDKSIANNYGNIIVTDLVGKSFPFIRYELGDVVELDGEKSYSDTYNGQVIKRLIGRSSELIKLKNGNYISEVSLHNAFRDIHIEGYRVEVRGDNITVTVIPTAGYSDEEEMEMIRVLKERTAGDFQIVCIKTNKMERRTNGKSLFIMTN